jgi:hypothetical protein
MATTPPSRPAAAAQRVRTAQPAPRPRADCASAQPLRRAKARRAAEAAERKPRARWHDA